MKITKRIYHDMPFLGVECQSTRHDSRERFERIASLVEIKDKVILDLGTCEGAIALGLKELGARMVFGIDDNAKSIEIARDVSEFLGYDADFKQESITLETIRASVYFDVIVWLSQWQWSVKQEGLEYGKELLFEASKKADVLVFESAAGGDGGGAIKGATQDDIEKWLLENTVYNDIVRYEAKGTWKGGQRDLFICSNPFVKETTKSYQDGKKVVVERISKDYIKKTWMNGIEYLKGGEVKALTRLRKYGCCPSIVENGDNYIIETYCGRESRITRDMAAQVPGIVEAFRKEGIVHQDLVGKNLLAFNGLLYVIDFSRAVFDGEQSKKHWRPRDINGQPYTDELAMINTINKVGI